MLPKLLLLLVIIASPCARGDRSVKNVLNSRIVGGRDANITEAPFQISLERDNRHRCGGSIISDIFIITGGHCTYNTTAKQLRVRAGTSFVESGGVLIPVKTVYRHPGFNLTTLDYDISLVKLVYRLHFTKSIFPIRLPGRHQLATGTPVQISGWGLLDEDGTELSSRLQLVTVYVVSSEDCQNAYVDEVITNRMVCSGFPGGGKDSCSGDSGGPVVAFKTLYGLVSAGYGCARAEYPGVNTNVVALREYIRKITRL